VVVGSSSRVKKVCTCLTTEYLLYEFRSKYYHFEEFLGQWLEKLKDANKTSMTVKLMKDIDRYRVSKTEFVTFCLFFCSMYN